MTEVTRPPYVQFETRAIEDRGASIETGHYVAKDIIFAIVTPTGSKDRVEREAVEWLKSVEEGVKQERIPGEWLQAYKNGLTAYINNQELPEDGTAIKSWPSASPAQIKLLLDIPVRTVEELAAANEETLGRIGMGARALKEKAQAWLDSAEGHGKLASELETLRQRNESLELRDQAREEQFQLLKKQVESLTEKQEA